MTDARTSMESLRSASPFNIRTITDSKHGELKVNRTVVITLTTGHGAEKLGLPKLESQEDSTLFENQTN